MKVGFLRFWGPSAGVIGFVFAGYAHFLFDPTISPQNLPSGYEHVDQNSPFGERAAAIDEIADRYKRARAGERIVSVERLATQQRIFYFGLFMMFLGAGMFGVSVQRSKQSNEKDDA
jgi:hypothetical protein